jgi:26S proteasome regulatory subunit N1
MLHHCDEHIDTTPKEKEKERDNKDEKPAPKVDDTFQSFAVLGIALVAMGEDVGAEMSIRQFNHLVSHFHLLPSLVTC